MTFGGAGLRTSESPSTSEHRRRSRITAFDESDASPLVPGTLGITAASERPSDTVRVSDPAPDRFLLRGALIRLIFLFFCPLIFHGAFRMAGSLFLTRFFVRLVLVRGFFSPSLTQKRDGGGGEGSILGLY